MADKKITILAVLGAVAVISLAYGIVTPSKVRQRAARAARMEAPAAREEPLSIKVLTAEERYPKRGSYSEWGKSPFIKSKEPEARGPLAKLVLGGIVWDAFSPKAVINDTIVVVGDEIEGRKVVAINPESVILSEGGKETRMGLGPSESDKE